MWRFLRSFDLKAVVIACGTVSSNCLEELQAENDIPIIGVVEPAVQRAVAAHPQRPGGAGRHPGLGLAAAPTSGSSTAWPRRSEVFSRACPLFVPLVEEGRCRPGDAVIETGGGGVPGGAAGREIDTLVLGCTHYPLLAEVIGQVMGPEVALVDAGAESARAVPDLLTERDALAERTGGSRQLLHQRPGGGL